MIVPLLSGVAVSERSAFPTLSQLCENDVDIIWSRVSSFIEQQMSSLKGVQVHGLGTFTFCQQRLTAGNKILLIQRPVFHLSEKLVYAYGLKQVKEMATGEVPVVPLNFTALTVDSPFHRDQVEGCVRETLQLLVRAVSVQHAVLFSLPRIGVLSFRECKVKMKFCRDFIMAMDATGQLLWALSNRPGTSTSVVSGRSSSLQRPGTQHTIQLPTLSSVEQGVRALTGKEVQEQGARALTGQEVQEQGARALTGQEVQEQGARALTGKEVQEQGARALTGKEVQEQGARALTGQEVEVKRKTTQHTREGEGQPPLLTEENNSCVMEEGERIGADTHMKRERTIKHPKEDTLQQGDIVEAAHLDLTCDGHRRAGQELCYLCMQRAQRNVPLYLCKKRLNEERYMDRMLLWNTQNRVQEYLLKEQVNKQLIQENNQKVAAFNLGVAEAMKMKLSESTELHSSYLLRERPATPARWPTQRTYMLELQAQVNKRQAEQDRARHESEVLEHLHRVQLANEITEQRVQQMHQRNEDVRSYQQALAIQVKERKPGVPAYQPNSQRPVFGKHDQTAEALLAQRQRAQQVYLEQLESAKNHQKEMRFRKLMEQRREDDMLHSDHEALAADRFARSDRTRGLRVSLEKSWRCSVALKQKKDLEERSYLRSGSCVLLEQSDGYPRCLQCKRRPTNKGTTNIWKESRYMAGSRLMA